MTPSRSPSEGSDEDVDKDGAEALAVYWQQVQQYTNAGLEPTEAEELMNLETRELRVKLSEDQMKRIADFRKKLLEAAQQRRGRGR